MNKINKFFLLSLAVILSISAFSQEEKKETFKPSMKVNGRIMYDFEFLSAGDYSFSGNEFRRVRLSAKGSAAKNMDYKVEFDFAGGAVNFRDVYLKLKAPGAVGNLLLGSFTEPSSLDNMTSSNYITFIERAMLVNTQPFKYNAGFMYDNQKLLDGALGLQMSYTFNGYLKKGDAFIDKSINEGGNFVGRLTGNLLNDKEKKQVVHLGLNYENRKNYDDFYKYSFRIENHMGGKIGVHTTDDDPDNDDATEVNGIFQNTSDIGFEAATTFGPLSVQAEYELSSIVTDINTYKATGYYAFASYFITGEHRPYKGSTFKRVKPKNEFCPKDGNFGALELVARFSVMDFSSYPGVNTKNAIANITAGFNWYLNPKARIMYNYTNANFNDLQTYGEDNLAGHQIRFQVDF